MNRLAWAVVYVTVSVGTLNGQELRTAHLGECQLVNKSVIQDCQLGYRTFGTLSAAKDNIVVIPTWASGRTEQMAFLIGPGKLIDSSKYYIVAIDAFANGVSSSPSNSKQQARMSFPQITIHDMVAAEHTLLTRELQINHVLAVMGFSMGGMQTFEWMVSYPNFMDKAIPIVGSPRLASYDLVLWETEIDAIKVDPAWMQGNYKANPAVLAETRLGVLTLSTPAAVNAQLVDGQIPQQAIDMTGAMDANDHIRQAEAMMALDISKTAGGTMQGAAKLVKAKVLVIVATQDHTVTPQPARDFAKLLSAPIIELDSPCGHISPFCELPKVGAAVGKFLSQ